MRWMIVLAMMCSGCSYTWQTRYPVVPHGWQERQEVATAWGYDAFLAVRRAEAQLRERHGGAQITVAESVSCWWRLLGVIPLIALVPLCEADVTVSIVSPRQVSQPAARARGDEPAAR